MDNLVLKNLKDLRRYHQLTLRQFADAIGASEGLISQIESGKCEPSAKTVAFVCQHFHVSPTTIYERDMLTEACNAALCVEKQAQGGRHGE